VFYGEFKTEVVRDGDPSAFTLLHVPG
jgi:hypothetical protein